MSHQKILVVGPACVGDMVMAQTLFLAIKAQNPDAVIDVLAPEWSKPLLLRMKEVRNSIGMPLQHGELKLKTRYKIAKTLRNENYTHAYVLPNSFKSALIPFWAKIPERIGWRGEMRYIVLNDVRILDKNLYPLMVQRYVALVDPNNALSKETLPKPKLTVPEEALKNTLQRYRLDLEKPRLVLCPGAEFGRSKKWPEKYYATVANRFLEKDWVVWLLGSPKDIPVGQAINAATKSRCIDLTGKTNLSEAIDLLSLASVVLSNDSGLMHIAASLDKPLVAVYGSTDPGFTPPLGEKVRILQETLSCRPCFKRDCPLTHHHCMLKLTPDKVIRSIETMVE